MICTKCKINKEVSLFGVEPRNKSGYASHCKFCKNEDAKKRAKLPKNLEKNKIKSSIYRKQNPEKFKLGVKMSSYKKQGIKITKQEYKKLYDFYNGYCAICGEHNSSQKKDLSLDHCHNTKKIRGFLCDNCNTGIGKFKDNINIMLKAIEYIVKHK
jgi:hypothetical protein